LQLSINALKPFDYHFELGTRLAPVRDQGVLIVGSGNVGHNLRRVDWTQPDEGFDWAQAFDNEAADVVTTNPADVVRLQGHELFPMAAPTPDHFIPLLCFAGLASAADESAHASCPHSGLRPELDRVLDSDDPRRRRGHLAWTVRFRRGTDTSGPDSAGRRRRRLPCSRPAEGREPRRRPSRC
jgi:hypothetical protein